MSKQLKTIFLSVALTGFIFSSTTAFAGSIYPGITDSCEQLWLVNDPSNPNLLPNEGGECVDVPAELKKVKVLFNLDNAVTKTSPKVVRDELGEKVRDENGKPVTEMVTEPVALRHMALLGKVMQYRIAEKGLDPSNVEIVGIFHGQAMSAMKWPFKMNQNPRVKFWIDQILALKDAGINIQLEVCGVTLKGMQKSMRDREFPTVNAWKNMDEKAVYGAGTDRRIYVNQGAVARIIDLQRNGFAYLQEE